MSPNAAAAGVRTTSNPSLSTDQIIAAFEQIYRLLQQSDPTPFSQPNFAPPTYQLPTFISVPGSNRKRKRNVKMREQHERKHVTDQIQEVERTKFRAYLAEKEASKHVASDRKAE